MKKRIKLFTVFMLVCSLAMPTFSFASTAKKETEAVKELTPITLSIDDAIKAMENSPQMEIVKLQKIADQAAATGAAEGLQSLKEAQDAIKHLTYMGDADSLKAADSIESSIRSISKTNLEALKKYAREMTEPNDMARRNDLKLQAIEMYYTLKNVEKMTEVAKESYNISETLYNSTLKKYKLGTVSKVDLLSAELNMAEAKDAYAQALNGLEQTKMGFNLFFGYDLMQPVTLSSEIAVPELPDITLEEAISSALSNRNELKQSEYQFNRAKKEFSSKSPYPHTSSTFLGAKANYIAAETDYKLKPALIEQDVRTKYMSMIQYHDALKTYEKSVSNAKESLRLVQLQYDNGLATLSLVQQAQLGYEGTLQSLAAATLRYSLSVLDFNYSYGVGTVAAVIN